MKASIHPKWNHQAQVKCACGNVFATGSQQDAIEVDICSVCHPFYTGEMRFVDVQGRVERFKQRQQAAQSGAGKKSKKKTEEKPVETKSLKELLQDEKTRLAEAA